MLSAVLRDVGWMRFRPRDRRRRFFDGLEEHGSR
jgi:hypothetical protein